MSWPPTGVRAWAEFHRPPDYVKRNVWDREIQLLMRDHPVDEVMADGLFRTPMVYAHAPD
ncbi:hypothetical protein [Streptomyces sp. NPDC005538]|uniref:hypothetical protein n=1 Tax=unclassified Streptomyces TaxID=2593676 RepID=UPI0033BEE1A9